MGLSSTQRSIATNDRTDLRHLLYPQKVAQNRLWATLLLMADAQASCGRSRAVILVKCLMVMLRRVWCHTEENPAFPAAKNETG